MRFDYAIVGGGIVGLATAHALAERFPDASILLLEKEDGPARHQTGRNSGVLHSGIYYAPGSLKARLCAAGVQSMMRFCDEYGIRYEQCGKVIVATHARELPQLERLYERGLQNGLNVQRLTSEEVRAYEPHVQAIAGIRVPSTGIVSYRHVSLTLVDLARARGTDVRFGTRVERLTPTAHGYDIGTTAGDFTARVLVNCAGLHSDRVARLAGTDPGASIVPFRGEYFELREDRRHLVRGLIYPVPNPDFPFLGVHFTRMIDGSVHAGPNAVLAFQREGYRKTDVNLHDLTEVLRNPGFHTLARKHLREGAMEMLRSWSKAAFVRSLQALIPEVTADDIVPCSAGVRAQAMADDGKLVDDFLLVDGPNALHVCNAPSPAATSSLEIGRVIAARVPGIAPLTPARPPLEGVYA
ncbi:L-2-hydroxyglutarate oxidase [Deinococcus maricopensis]|uniref:FAD dependent oxidoreductase n=1 Tax=Deinococcus maricopensis (strain DSM 21211 / LMG 22137 / NRRL B-23946 / LB-34) TaxID=709986 RepID=E8U3F9_DEIML|nr:L-2-hydroxyglutarate oxidase [Deinococcus maricopensis]ADV65830.1 FAD dependent oxidoreductase [Deinococcus maricopensis DSM 21211]